MKKKKQKMMRKNVVCKDYNQFIWISIKNKV